jgi:hypothetical protein
MRDLQGFGSVDTTERPVGVRPTGQEPTGGLDSDVMPRAVQALQPPRGTLSGTRETLGCHVGAMRSGTSLLTS